MRPVGFALLDDNQSTYNIGCANSYRAFDREFKRFVYLLFMLVA
jgi:hypothetical protein